MGSPILVYFYEGKWSIEEHGKHMLFLKTGKYPYFSTSVIRWQKKLAFQYVREILSTFESWQAQQRSLAIFLLVKSCFASFVAPFVHYHLHHSFYVYSCSWKTNMSGILMQLHGGFIIECESVMLADKFNIGCARHGMPGASPWELHPWTELLGGNSSMA